MWAGSLSCISRRISWLSFLSEIDQRKYISRKENLHNFTSYVGIGELLHSQKRHRQVASKISSCTGLLQLVNKLQEACQFHQVATSLLKSGLLQLVICILVTTCCNKPVEIINLQQACWQLATDLLSQAVASHANASWYRLAITSCYKMSTDLLQLGRFWLCRWGKHWPKNHLRESRIRLHTISQ